MGRTEREEEREIKLSLALETIECVNAEPPDGHCPAHPPAFYPHVTFRPVVIVR